MVILNRPHFTVANFTEKCSQCGVEIKRDALMLVEIISGRTVYSCEPCGRKILEAS